ncbi:WXG100 family type VII secretion target [Dactylosporangium darangshiense]|uniref:WXG100 family type VII secretion target n=1 Tax=Dactylosporangium darangshiense TaxID=579108 RepID=A0ABP8DVH0_9ACTN
MAGTQKKVDEASVLALVSAFNAAVNDLENAERTVQSSSADLGARWLGDASVRYQQGLREVSQGLVTIRAGLSDITDDMQRFASVTNDTEDDNLARAAGITLQGDSFSARASWTD